MSKWTHSQCADCWRQNNPNREPYTLTAGDDAICCWCGKETNSGIFVRSDPKKLRCKGEHNG